MYEQAPKLRDIEEAWDVMASDFAADFVDKRRA